jgi:hypothetical protein
MAMRAAPTLQRKPAARGAPVQAKLTVGPVGDVYEEEADRVAERMDSAAPVMAASPPPTISRLSVQRSPFAPTTGPQEEETLAAPETRARRHGQCLAHEAAQTGAQCRCASCEGKKRRLQAKLDIGRQGDIYEQEADRVAERVLETPLHAEVSPTPPRIQRIREQSAGHTEAAPASVDHALASPGAPLEPALRQDMEQRFGHDFSKVRVHSDTLAERSARDVNARAYTVGHHIVFGATEFAPATRDGRRLLAHELTHVVQQRSAPMLQSQRVDPGLAGGSQAGQGHEKRGSSPVSAVPAPISGGSLAVARKPRTGATEAPPEAVRRMTPEEARSVLAAYIATGGTNDALAAMNAIQATLDTPSTPENRIKRLGVLTAAFSLLDDASAAAVLKALTAPVGPTQEHLRKRFLRIDPYFQNRLLDILRERPAAKAVQEAERAEKPSEGASSGGNATWIELHPGVFAYVPKVGMTLNAVAAYVSDHPDVPAALAKLNDLSRTTPIAAGQSIIIPVEFIERAKAFQEMSEPMRRHIASTQVAQAEHGSHQRFLQVRSRNPLGPGIGGSMLLTAKLTAGIIERVVNALIGLIKKAAYVIAFVAGVVHGFLKSIWDAISGIAKLIYEILKSHFSGEIVSDIGKLAGSIQKLSWDKIKDVVGTWAGGWAEKLDSTNPLIAGHAHGYLTGYVMAEAAMVLLTGGTVAASKVAIWTSKLGELVRASRAFKTLESAIAKTTKFRRAAGDKFDKAVDALRQSRLGTVVKAAEVTGAAIVWTVDKVKTVLKLPSDIAVYVVDKAVAHAKQLSDFFPRIGALTDRAKRWLFGCRSPCDWTPDGVANTMRALPDNTQIEEAAKLAARAPTPSVAKPQAPKPAAPVESPKPPSPAEPPKRAPSEQAPPARLPPEEALPPPRTREEAPPSAAPERVAVAEQPVSTGKAAVSPRLEELQQRRAANEKRIAEIDSQARTHEERRGEYIKKSERLLREGGPGAGEKAATARRQATNEARLRDENKAEIQRLQRENDRISQEINPPPKPKIGPSPAQPHGGAHKDIPTAGGEVNHIPPESVMQATGRVIGGRGPAIWMEIADHWQTNSWGQRTFKPTRKYPYYSSADEWRAAQAELIRKGKIREAVQMDIDDIQSKFGSKYDKGIQEMLAYMKKLYPSEF